MGRDGGDIHESDVAEVRVDAGLPEKSEDATLE